MGKWMTIREVAAEMRVSPDTVHRWVRSGQLPAADVSGRGCRRASWRIDSRGLDQFIKSRANKPQPRPRRRPRRHGPGKDVIEFIK